jgi:hypothetical protein
MQTCPAVRWSIYTIDNSVTSGVSCRELHSHIKTQHHIWWGRRLLVISLPQFHYYSGCLLCFRRSLANFKGALDGVLVEVLYYKLGGRGIETALWECMFSMYLILSAALASGVYSTSNRNEYHKQKIIFLGSRSSSFENHIGLQSMSRG